MNINDLTKDQLNTLAALGQGRVQLDGYYWTDRDGNTVCDGTLYDPCNNGGQAMELVEKYRIDIRVYDDIKATVTEPMVASCFGASLDYKTAITKAFVASVYGVELDYDSIVQHSLSGTGGE